MAPLHMPVHPMPDPGFNSQRKIAAYSLTRWVVFRRVVKSAVKLRPDIYKTVTDDELDILLSDERIQNIIDEDTKKRQFQNTCNLVVLPPSQLASGEGRLGN
ncbi:hypothetical protein BYT27DRAFT_7336674 [Phlegmacium glaucopus]|nr:hypothetical protein BYT27DRAFT_7336674 [Phlegmacium glaucopus]